MPKMKTNKATAKRVKISKGGKIQRHKAGGRHLMSSKGPKRRRHLQKTEKVSDAERKKMKQLLPYSCS